MFQLLCKVSSGQFLLHQPVCILRAVACAQGKEELFSLMERELRDDDRMKPFFSALYMHGKRRKRWLPGNEEADVLAIPADNDAAVVQQSDITRTRCILRGNFQKHSDR